jgi:hypothetical protein
MARGLILLADGLRPDAITPSTAPSLHALAHDYTRAAHAITVRPSTTLAALGSLATGVAPGAHALVQSHLVFPRGLGRLRPVPLELKRRGLPTVVVAACLPAIEVPTASALAGLIGVTRFVSGVRTAPGVAARALERFHQMHDGLGIVYVNDCDRAGHASGWMSPAYLDAVREVDAAVRVLRPFAADSLLIVLADHGGGGVAPTDHDAPHLVNDRIPLILAGPRTRRRHVLSHPVSILDVPVTMLWWLGVEAPASYEGRLLHDAFVAAEPVGAVA